MNPFPLSDNYLRQFIHIQLDRGNLQFSFQQSQINGIVRLEEEDLKMMKKKKRKQEKKINN